MSIDFATLGDDDPIIIEITPKLLMQMIEQRDAYIEKMHRSHSRELKKLTKEKKIDKKPIVREPAGLDDIERGYIKGKIEE